MMARFPIHTPPLQVRKMAEPIMNQELNYGAAIPTFILEETRQTNTIVSASPGPFTPQGPKQFRIDLPSEKFLDSRETYLSFKLKQTAGTITSGDSSEYRLSQAGAQAIFRKVSVRSIDGNLIEEIDRYNVLHSLKHKLMPFGFNESVAKFTEAVTSDLTSLTNRKEMRVTVSLASLGSMFTVQYLPLFIGKLYLQFELEDAEICMVTNPATVGVPSYEVSEMELKVSVVDVAAAFKTQLIESVAAGIPLRLPFDTWRHHPEAITGVSERNLIFSVYKTQFKAIWIIIRTTASLSDPTADQLVNYFFPEMLEYQINIDGNQFPTKAVKCDRGGAEVFTEMLKAMGTWNKSIPTSITSDFTSHNADHTLDGLSTILTGSNFIIAKALGCAGDKMFCGINTRTNPSNTMVYIKMRAVPVALSITAFSNYNANLVIRSDGITVED